MKYRTSLFFFFLGITHLVTAEVGTELSATKLGYPQHITALRNKTERFLNTKKITLALNVQELRDQGKNLRAQELEQLNEQDYNRLVEKIDRTFDDITREFLQGSSDLDNRETSEKEHKEFIIKLMKKATEKIGLLLHNKGAYHAK